MAILIGWIAKGVTILATFVNVRLIIDVVGLEGFAAHSILLSLLTWLSLLNLGVPTAIQNKISLHRANSWDTASIHDAARSTLKFIVVLLQPVIAIIAIASHAWLFGSYPFVSVGALWFACLAMTASGLTLVYNQTLYAEHRFVWPNLYPVFLSVGSCVGLLIVREWGGGTFDELVIAFFVPYFLAFVVAATLLPGGRRTGIRWSECLEIVRSARGYALFSLLLAGSSAVDYIVLSQTVEPSEIGEYAIANRMFVGLLSLYGVILATRWPAFAELMAKSEFARVYQQLSRMVLFGLSFAAAGITVIVLARNIFAPLLSAGKVSTIRDGLVIGWSLYLLVRIWTDSFTATLLGNGQTRTVNVSMVLQTILGVLFQLCLVKPFGATGVVVGMSLGAILSSAWILPSRLVSLVRKGR